MRRFEYIQGNQAKFWEIARRGATLTVASGRIGGQTKTRTKQLADYMAAEQEFDRLIRDHLRRGYVEVAEASAPEAPSDERRVRLRMVQGDETLELPPAAVRYVSWRMIEIGAMDKQLEAPDLERWAHRASRRLRLEDAPEEGDEGYEAFRAMFLELSEADRAAESGQHGVVAAFKLLSGSDWVVTAREAGWLAEATKNRTPRRHKISTNQQQWLDAWGAFNERAAKQGGYRVEDLG